MQKSSQLFVVAALLLIAALVASMPAQARSAIVIGSGESTRAQISAALLVQVLRQSGFKARSQVIDDGVRVSALERGLVQILPEVPVADVAQHFSSALRPERLWTLASSKPARPTHNTASWLGPKPGGDGPVSSS